MSQLWAAYQELERTQWLDPAEIERLQLAQARTLLRHCADHVPYYRRLLAERGIVPEAVRTPADFRRIPVLRAADVPGAIRRLSGTQLAARHPAGKEGLHVRKQRRTGDRDPN